MVPRLGHHLLRVKSKAETLGLFALYPCYFLYPNGQLLTVIKETVSLTQY